MVRTEQVRSRRRALGIDAARAGSLLAIIAAVSLLHVVTRQPEVVWHGLLLRVYYIPILVGAYWYGAFGGLFVAMVCSVGYLPHLHEQGPAFEAGRYAEIVAFHLIGLTVGLLATAQRGVTERYQQAAMTLEQANNELRRSYQQLQRADRLKTLGEVAAGLAHEIRHPLASIRGALEIIEERSMPDSPEAEFSRLAMGEVQRLDNLVWEFLRFARPHEPDRRPTSLHDVVTRVINLLRVEAERRRVTLVVDRLATMPDASIDAMQVEQVLLNVILNAIQASPPGACVRVYERADTQQVGVDVIDEGPGIPDMHLAYIFDPFFTTKDKGTGLGLAIAHRIVLAHDGQIEVRQASPVGASIRIRLPVSAASSASGDSTRPVVAI